MPYVKKKKTTRAYIVKDIDNSIHHLKVRGRVLNFCLYFNRIVLKKNLTEVLFVTRNKIVSSLNYEFCVVLKFFWGKETAVLCM